ncbi:hypothetical protein Glove_243g107 [Diversispora epigaea]|uniref:Uncharacterized protein n=1 Tax=Diversispora epigaea TaxID=1348612 RepID=A0A397I912_9GLOM|nr:hypothetical protein Glove_243g107 [Diversispora epigaea]
MSSELVTPSSIASNEEIITYTMENVIKDYDIEKPINYLQRRNLKPILKFLAKLQSFLSYKTVKELKELLKKYKVNGEEITDIKQFNQVWGIFLYHRMLSQSNNNLFFFTVFEKIDDDVAYTKEEKLYISLQKDVSGEEASGRVDYAIKGKECC